MKRVLLLGGAGCVVLVIAGICLAAQNPGQQGSQPAVRQTGGGLRQLPPPTSGSGNAVRAAYQAQAAAKAAAAANAQAARAAQGDAAANRAITTMRSKFGMYNPQPSASSPSSGYSSSYPYNGYGNPYGYPYGYGYPSYGYSYGATPYVMGYDPYTGEAYYYPAQGYSPYGYSPYGYRHAYNPFLGWGYPPAVFADASQIYGLGPIQRLMGLNQLSGPAWNVGPMFNGNVNPNAGVNGNNNENGNNAPRNRNRDNDQGNNGAGGDNAANNNAAAARKPAAAPGAKSIELAWKFITFGDAQFSNLEYTKALSRYMSAAHECPKLGDAWMREGFAQAAMGKYDQAAKSMRRGLAEKPDWADANFRLNELYGENADDKKANLDAMTKASEARPTNGELALVVGIHLYCDGKPDQAAPFFRRAAQILGDDALVKPFLDKAQ